MVQKPVLFIIILYPFILYRETCFDTMTNYHLSQSCKLMENDEFNQLTIILINSLEIEANR